METAGEKGGGDDELTRLPSSESSGLTSRCGDVCAGRVPPRRCLDLGVCYVQGGEMEEEAAGAV